MLPVNCGSHADYQNFVVTNLRKYYPNPNALARSTWDIIERFWNLDLSFTDTFMADKYSKFGPTPRTPSCMQRSYLLSIDFKVTSLTEWAAQLKMNPLYAMLSLVDLKLVTLPVFLAFIFTFKNNIYLSKFNARVLMA